MTPLVIGELVRLRTTGLLRWTVIIALLAGASLTGLLAVIDPQQATPPLPGIDTVEGASLVLGINSFLLFVPALIGTIAITGEYRHRTIATTLLVAPRRGRLLAAKLIAYGLLGLLYGVLTATAAGAALLATGVIRDTAVALSTGQLLTSLVRLAVAAAVYLVLGVAIGAVVRRQLVAVGLVLGYFYLLEPLLMIIPGANAIYPYLPGGATAAIMDVGFLTDALASELAVVAPSITAVTGALLLLGYAAVASAVAIALPLRRDLR